MKILLFPYFLLYLGKEYNSFPNWATRVIVMISHNDYNKNNFKDSILADLTPKHSVCVFTYICTHYLARWYFPIKLELQENSILDMLTCSLRVTVTIKEFQNSLGTVLIFVPWERHKTIVLWSISEVFRRPCCGNCYCHL